MWPMNAQTEIDSADLFAADLASRIQQELASPLILLQLADALRREHPEIAGMLDASMRAHGFMRIPYTGTQAGTLYMSWKPMLKRFAAPLITMVLGLWPISAVLFYSVISTWNRSGLMRIEPREFEIDDSAERRQKAEREEAEEESLEKLDAAAAEIRNPQISGALTKLLVQYRSLAAQKDLSADSQQKLELFRIKYLPILQHAMISYDALETPRSADDAQLSEASVQTMRVMSMMQSALSGIEQNETARDFSKMNEEISGLQSMLERDGFNDPLELRR